MKRIERHNYLQKLIAFKDKKLIKVITGIRRCGKSTIMEIYRDWLIAHGVTQEQIIYLNFEDYDYFELRDPRKLYSYVKPLIQQDKMTYIFFDEIQHVTDFPDIINSLNLKPTVDLYVDPNTRTDYGKMKKLLQFDKLDGERKGIIRKIAEEEQIVTQLYESFSAYQIPKAEIFPSLLFYYGMLTIKGTRGSKLILGIPNNNVRKQYYGYLEEEYQAKAYVDVNQLTDYYYDMAYDGKWEEGLRFMADAYAKVSSVRDGIEAERNLQGFFMAYLNLNDYYITAPELELNHGYCDFFLLPDLTHYASQHSYILELKVLSKKDFSAIVEGEFTEDGKPMTKAEKQWREAVDQIHRYAEAPRVEALRQGTKLHLIIMQFEGWELKRMEEV